MYVHVFEPTNFHVSSLDRACALFDALYSLLAETNPEPPAPEVVDSYLEKLVSFYKFGVGSVGLEGNTLILYHPEREDMAIKLVYPEPIPLGEREVVLERVLETLDDVVRVERVIPSDPDEVALLLLAEWGDIPACDLNSLIPDDLEVEDAEEWF